MFISYSWSNSHSAAEKSGKFGPGALGWADPRQIKAVLQEAGIRCWIDIEMVGKEKVNFLTLCILGNFACFLSSADFFFIINFFLIISGIPAECQTAWIQIRLNVLFGLIWVQTIYKGYQHWH